MSTDPSTPVLDAERLEALRRTGLLDSPAEERFDRLTRLASRLLGVPVALVSLVDEDRQFFKSCFGLPEPWASRRETPLSHSFCQHVVIHEEPLIVEDAREHPLVRDNLAIADLGVVAYAGIPLTTTDGRVLGSFCAIDTRPRKWTEDEIQALRDLAGAVCTEIELRTAARDLVEGAEAALGRHEASEEARRRVTRILESITEAFFALDRDWRFTYLNGEAEKLLHRPREALLGKGIWEEFPEAVGSTFYEQYHRAARERRTVQFEEYYPPLEAWFEVRAFPSEEGLSVYFHDLTARKRLEETIRESESRFRIMFRDSPLPMWVFDLETRAFLDVNETAVRQYGYSREEFLSMTLADIRPREEVPQLDRAFTPDRRGIVHQGLFRHRKKDGSVIDVEVTTQEITFGDRAARVAVVLDVTERVRAEAERERLIRELEQERERLRSIFAQAPAVIALYHGPEHVIRVVNPTWEQVVGRRGVVGKPLREVFPELEGSGLLELLDQVYRTGEPFVGNELRVMFDRTGSGVQEESFWNFVWQPLTDGAGRVTDVFVHAVEVTDQVRARRVVEQKAEELARLARALEVSNRELDQFAYVASHDLKAPLRGIANLSQWIEEDVGARDLSQDTREHLALLRGRVHRMEGLIDGILQYSRAGRVRERPEEVDTGALVREVVDLLAPPGNVAVEPAPGLPVLVTERLPLQQVLMNLVGNAVKYTRRPDARIQVAAEDAGDFWEFRVRDNGPGIAPEYHERIFGIFQTLEARDKVEGTGIGLSLVKKIVESRGGRVWVESFEGAGSTFRFLWPKEIRGGEQT